MSFADPLWLWLVAAAGAACVGALLRHRRRLRGQKELASPAVWQRLMGGAPATGLLRMVAWSVALALVGAALARPQWGEAPKDEEVVTRDLVLALDVSDSMRCPDLPPSRLQRSLELVQRLLPSLEGNRVGVVVFAGEAYPLLPLTHDLEAVSTFLSAVEPGMIGLPGSNLEQAVAAGLRLLPDSGEGRLVALFTDGENLQGDVARAVAALRSNDVPLLAVMAGTAGGGPIPVPEGGRGVHYRRDREGRPVVTRARPEVLRELADAADGALVDLGSSDPISRFLARVEELRTRQVQDRQSVRRVERFPLFLLAAAAALALGFGLSPWRRAASLVVVASLLALPAAAQTVPPAATPAAVASADGAGADGPGAQAAGPPVPWWQRWLPGGSRRMARTGAGHWAKGDLPGAGRAFAGAAVLDPENPERLYDLGTAVAAAGEVEQAAPVLGRAHQGGAEHAAYNLGTAALTAGQAELAVSALRQALLLHPDAPEVKRNYELALELLEEQQQQQQQQEQQEQQDQEDEEQEEQQEEQEQSQPQPTPTPTPEEDQLQPLFDALERAEEEAREEMNKPTPQAASVEKDW